MVQITISVSDSVYAWLAQKAESRQESVESVVAEEVSRLRENDSFDTEFRQALRESMDVNRELLKRLAE